MVSQILGPRKQRTRQHVIADLSVHHIEGFILEAGHTVLRLSSDYGYDLIIFTYDAQGYVEPGFLLLQLKAAETWQANGGAYVFDLDIRDYNLWMHEKMPVILVLFDATRRRACWLAIQSYFRADATRQPKKGTKTVRVRVHERQVVSHRAIAKLRDLKWEWHTRAQGAPT
jgi:hypothetical protein